MNKNKKILVIFFALVLSMVLTVSLVACKTECKHKFGEWVNRNGEETYCENRLYFRECENCGEEEWKGGAESDHDFEVETVEPTCSTGGYDLKTCKVCGKIEVISGTETSTAQHDINSVYLFDGINHWQACDDCDYETEHSAHVINDEYLFDRINHWQACDNCHYETEHSAHTYNNNDVCSVCGKQAAMEGLIFTDMGDYYEVTGYDDTEKNVVIPSSHNGKPVTSIGDRAFYQNYDIESVVIGSNVNTIGYKAFSNCYWLTTVYIPDSVTVIGENAFWNCTRLTSVYIPQSVIEIGVGAFAACTNLTSFTVNEDCLTYKSVDGSLYSKDGKILIQYAIGKTDEVFEVPDGVETIGDYAFMSGLNLTSIIIGDDVKSIGDLAFVICLNLTSVIIGDDVTSIGVEAFFYCPKLSSVLIPSGMESIGDRAFSYCNNLFSVYCYEESDFTIGVENEPLTDATVYYYSESAPTEDGNYWHYVDGKIEVWQENASQGLEFELNEDGVSYSVIGMGECEDTEIVIPNFYNGLPVTNIGEYAFSENEDIISVVIPDSVKRIQTAAFASCPSLERVTVGKGVKEILPGALSNCPSLTAITVDEENADFKSIDGSVYSKDGKTFVQYAMGKTDSAYVIPSSVEVINVGAFAHSPYLTEIVIPDSVERIHIAAFYHCESLVSVVIGKSVEYIHELAFNDCSKLAFVCYAGTESEWTSVNIVGDNNYIHFATIYYYNEINPMVVGNYWHYGDGGKIEIWEYTAVAGLRYKLNPSGSSYSVIGIGDYEDAELTIPSVYNGLPITNIGEYAFAENGMITRVVIPDSVKSIEATAFASCELLRSVIIGKGVESIGFGAFTDCLSLTEITVDANNAAYKHIDGNLYTKDGKTLVQYATGKTDSVFVIPSFVEEIAVGAFAYSHYLTDIVIHDTVKKIGISAFYNCDNLESVVISQSVEYIGFSAFDECDKLAYAYYLGSESEWDNIAIGGEDDELFAIEVLYYYSENSPTKSGNYWHYNNGEIEIWD